MPRRRNKNKNQQQLQQTNLQNNEDIMHDFTRYNRIVGANNPLVNSLLYNPFYMNELLKHQDTLPKKFKRDDIINWIANPASSELQLRQLNQYLLNSSQLYKRTIAHFASLLLYDYLLFPTNADESDINTVGYKRSYNKVISFLEDQFDLKEEFSKIMKIIMSEDVFFCYERKNGEDYTLQKLPSAYCKITGRNEKQYFFAFDMTYFLLPGVNIKDFPPEFEEYVAEMKQGYTNTGTYYVLLDPDKAFCFKFDETIATIIPPLLGVYLDVLEISEYKDLVKSRAQLDNYMLLHQKMPQNTDKTAKANHFFIDPDTAATFHNAVKASLPQGIGIATTPMELMGITLDKSQNKDSIVGIGESQYYKSSGLNPMLMADTSSSVGLNKSIQADEAFVIHMFRQFERWLNWKLANISGKYKFRLIFPDITYYNREDKLDSYLNSAQYGMPKMFIGAAMGLTPNQFITLSKYENAIGLVDEFRPLQSSHINTNNNNPKSDSQITDSGVQSRDNETVIKRNEQ